MVRLMIGHNRAKAHVFTGLALLHRVAGAIGVDWFCFLFAKSGRVVRQAKGVANLVGQRVSCYVLRAGLLHHCEGVAGLVSGQ